MTNLSSVFEQLAAKRAGQSIRLAILLSDGRHNDDHSRRAARSGPAIQQAAGLRRADRQLDSAVRDVLLHRVEAPAAVAEKDSAVIDVIVTGQDCEGRSTQVCAAARRP